MLIPIKKCCNALALIKVSILTLLLAFLSEAYGRPIVVVLEKELTGAKYVEWVVIKKYSNKGKIFFYSVENPNRVRSVRSGAYKKYRRFKGPVFSYCSGTWPVVSDTVLIAIDSLQEVRLFAEKTEGNLRFWSPGRAGTVYSYQRPAFALPNQDENGGPERYYSFDGCLLPESEISKYLKPSH